MKKNTAIHTEKPQYTSIRNACKQCSPLGASVVFRGVEQCVPLIHGSQGCATYIRRYLISHFKEPMDIASSSFSENATIFGGKDNLFAGISNIISQYNPKVIAITSTCLSETIGEDVKAMLLEYKNLHSDMQLPQFIFASTPSYAGTHMDGFHEAVKSLVETCATDVSSHSKVNIMPGFVSPADIRHLKDILHDYELDFIMIPDFSESLDNPSWEEYKFIPDGGTSIDELQNSGGSQASIEFGYVLNKGGLSGRVKTNIAAYTAAEYLEKKHSVPRINLGMPIGIKQSDAFFTQLEKLSGKAMPDRYYKQRGRLIDSYVDAHKYVFGKRVVVYGEEDFVIGITQFLLEVGIKPILIASGGESGKMKEIITQLCGEEVKDCIISTGMDFEKIQELSANIKPDLFIGNSKGYYITRKLQIPLIRVGFPIHDRFGGQRVQHLCYEGTQQLFDTITNALVAYKQEKSHVGYKYM
ncbi:MAG: nitrogenase component 1 [Bacteroidota bacterium]